MKLDDFKKENIIDLRKKEDYLEYHIDGSRNIDFIALLGRTSEYLNRNEKYLLICDKGIQSLSISNILKKKGYFTYSLDGGIKKLKKTLANFKNI